MTIRALDGLRGLAVLLIPLSHMSLHDINLIEPLNFSGIGKAGVYLFFALSAFLLTWQALQLEHNVMECRQQDLPLSSNSHPGASLDESVSTSTCGNTSLSNSSHEIFRSTQPCNSS